jgi:transcriptional regulator with XRE-family HTH domain
VDGWRTGHRLRLPGSDRLSAQPEGAAVTVAPSATSDPRLARPFHLLLRMAIQASGLSLESLRRRLLARGVRVSVATLSYWQRGLRRPEHDDSLVALLALEEILELPRASLLDTLGPRRPRGRWLGHPGGITPWESLLGVSRPRLAAFGSLDMAADTRLTNLSTQDQVVLTAERGIAQVSTQLVLRGAASHADTFIAVRRVSCAAPPELTALAGCRIGRARHDADLGLIAAEVMFDHPLAVDEPLILSYDTHFTEPARDAAWCLPARRPLRQYAIQVRFHPSATPARCFTFHADAASGVARDIDEVWVGRQYVANAVLTDVPPGCFGVRWEWE